MNAISKDDVSHIAKLARIHLTPKEITKFTGELSHILEYIQQLQDIDTRGVPPATHATGDANVLREDIAQKQGSDVRDALFAVVPTREGEHVKVQSIFQ